MISLRRLGILLSIHADWYQLCLKLSKVCIKLSLLYLHELFHNIDNVYNLRGGNLLDQPRVDTENMVFILRYQGARSWNSLPSYMKLSDSLEECKSHLTRWNGPEYTCGYCLLYELHQINVLYMVHFQRSYISWDILTCCWYVCQLLVHYVSCWNLIIFGRCIT